MSKFCESLSEVLCGTLNPTLLEGPADGFRGRQIVDFEHALSTLRGGPGTSAWCFRREALVEAGLFDVRFRRMQDYELLIRLSGQGFGVLRHDEPLFHYRPSIERGNTYGPAHQAALETFAITYGATDPPAWISERLDPGVRRRIRGSMLVRAMNVAFLRGDLNGASAFAGQAAEVNTHLDRSHRLQVELALRAPAAYTLMVQKRNRR